jgi:acyl carrier protein
MYLSSSEETHQTGSPCVSRNTAGLVLQTRGVLKNQTMNFFPQLRGGDVPMLALRELMAGILMCEPEALPADATPLRELAGWDSLKHVLLVVGLEHKLNAKLTAEEIQGIVTVADVGRVLEQKGADA